MREVEEYGVDIDEVRLVQEPTGKAIIQVTEEGENCISTFCVLIILPP